MTGLPDTPRIGVDFMRCDLLDLILGLTFDTAELEYLLQSADVHPADCICHPQRGPIAHVHALAHRDPRFARYLESVLDLRHADALERVEALGEFVGLELQEELDAWHHPRISGVAWALARSTRPEIAEYLPRFTHALAVDAVRALAERIRAEPVGRGA